jgi:hypothetical protein
LPGLLLALPAELRAIGVECVVENLPKRFRPAERQRHRALPFHDLPLFATDAKLGKALLDAARAAEWKDLASLYEQRGLPKIDPVMGGRFTPAVRRFFGQEYGMATVIPLAPKGVENPEGMKTDRPKAPGLTWAPPQAWRDPGVGCQGGGREVRLSGQNGAARFLRH